MIALLARPLEATSLSTGNLAAHMALTIFYVVKHNTKFYFYCWHKAVQVREEEALTCCWSPTIAMPTVGLFFGSSQPLNMSLFVVVPGRQRALSNMI